VVHVITHITFNFQSVFYYVYFTESYKLSVVWNSPLIVSLIVTRSNQYL